MTDTTDAETALKLRRRTPEETENYYLKAIAELLHERSDTRAENERLTKHAENLERTAARIRAILADEPPVDPAAAATYRDGWQAGHRRMAETVTTTLDADPRKWLPRGDFASEIEWYHDVGVPAAEPERCPVGDWRTGFADKCDVRVDAAGRPVHHVWRRVWFSRPQPGFHGDDGTLATEKPPKDDAQEPAV